MHTQAVGSGVHAHSPRSAVHAYSESALHDQSVGSAVCTVGGVGIARTVGGVRGAQLVGSVVCTDGGVSGASTLSRFGGPCTVGLFGSARTISGVGGSTVSRVSGAGGVRKVNEVQSVPTLHGVCLVHTVCGDVGGKSVGVQHGVCTAGGEGRGDILGGTSVRTPSVGSSGHARSMESLVLAQSVGSVA